MRTKLYLIPMLCSMALLTSCKSGDQSLPLDKPSDPVAVDRSTSCTSVQEAGLFQTFYKPQQGFVGDPMPYYNADDKKFYLFYLYENANRHPIYVSRTSDYAKFDGFTEILPAGAAGSQDEWIGTGSFIKKGQTYFCFYTGHNDKLNPTEKVMVATSTDLLNWTKQPSRTIQAAPGYDQNNFRDPHVYWDETRGSYVMLVTTRKEGKGAIARYVSADLNNWSNIAPIVAMSTAALEKNQIETDAEMLECPDLFKMGYKWYLTFSRINRMNIERPFTGLLIHRTVPGKSAVMPMAIMKLSMANTSTRARQPVMERRATYRVGAPQGRPSTVIMNCTGLEV